jgi:hypothetical protein
MPRTHFLARLFEGMVSQYTLDSLHAIDERLHDKFMEGATPEEIQALELLMAQRNNKPLADFCMFYMLLEIRDHVKVGTDLAAAIALLENGEA